MYFKYVFVDGVIFEGVWVYFDCKIGYVVVL